MAIKVKVSDKLDDDYDIILLFKNVKLLVLTDPAVYDDKETAEIERIVNHMSREIIIDKSYVTFPENKHQDTFILLDGWNSLCRLLKKTKFGKTSGDIVDEVIIEAFRNIISAYMYDILDKFGYDIEDIAIDFVNNDGLDVKFFKDTILEWKYYPGPWQDWGLDEEK